MTIICEGCGIPPVSQWGYSFLKYPSNFTTRKELPEVTRILDELDRERFWREQEMAPEPRMPSSDDEADALRRWADLGDGRRMKRRLSGAE